MEEERVEAEMEAEEREVVREVALVVVKAGLKEEGVKVEEGWVGAEEAAKEEEAMAAAKAVWAGAACTEPSRRQREGSDQWTRRRG